MFIRYVKITNSNGTEDGMDEMVRMEILIWPVCLTA